MKHPATLADVAEWLRSNERHKRAISQVRREYFRADPFSESDAQLADRQADEYAAAALVVERVIHEAAKTAAEAVTSAVEAASAPRGPNPNWRDNACSDDSPLATQEWVRAAIAEAVKANTSEIPNRSAVPPAPFATGDIVIDSSTMQISRVRGIWWSDDHRAWLFDQTIYPGMNPCPAARWEKLK